MATKLATKSIKFKEYEQKQVLSIPIELCKLIAEGHLCRIIDKVIEGMDISLLESYYKTGGCPAYHPKMLLKVWLYGYCERYYTSRRLEKAMRENINFLWLSGNQHPCFKTLSSFRGSRMEGMVDVVFKEVLLMLVEMGYVKLDAIYTDGTKMEANANRHKIIWRKNTERYKLAVEERIEKLLANIKQLQVEEDAIYGSKNLEELGTGESITVLLTSQEVQNHLQKLETLLVTESAKAKQQEEQTQKRVKALKKLSKELGQEAVKLAKYEQQEVVLAGRNSYSKTDTDATYLQMKRDESLPAYNIQQSTCSQYIVNYTISSNASDSPTFPTHVEKQAERLEGIKSLKGINYVADAGYGSEENYAFCEQKEIESYIKYPLWYQEISGELAKRKFRVENWAYNPTNDTFSCPNNRILIFKAEQVQLSVNQYERTIKLYQSENCQDCPFAEECKKGNNPRSVSFSPKAEAYKEKAKALLDTDIGKEKRKERSVEVETPFGNIKLNMQYERFVLRGKQKVYIEYGLLAIAHNLRKVYCHQSGVWKDYYIQRATKKQKRA